MLDDISSANANAKVFISHAQLAQTVINGLDQELLEWVQARANLQLKAVKPLIEISFEDAGARVLELAQEPQAVRVLGPIVLNFAWVADGDRATIYSEDFQVLAPEYNWKDIGHLRAVRAVKRGQQWEQATNEWDA